MVELREITSDNLQSILMLNVSHEQRNLVASNAVSIAEAHFAPNAWFRAIYANDEPVGFVMVADAIEEQSAWLWRLMVDARYQRSGYGRQALQMVIDRARATPGVRTMYLSYAPTDGNAGPFYRRLGFRETGEIDDGEIVMALYLDREKLNEPEDVGDVEQLKESSTAKKTSE
jgi:diamine N-acetyltransferase